MTTLSHFVTICCKCCKCCQKCCENEINDSITVLRKKVDGCKIFGYVYYEEKYEKIEVKNIEYDQDQDYEIIDVDNDVLNINNTKLYDDNYSIRIFFKRENLCDWFCETFCNCMVISLLFVNFLIDLQLIGFTDLYSEFLENMSYKENSKELLKYLYFTIIYGMLYYFLIPTLYKIFSKCNYTIFEIKKYTFLSGFMYIIFIYNIVIIIQSIYRYFNWFINKKAFIFNAYTNLMSLNNVSKIIWMNQIGQKSAKDFLNFTGLLSLGNIIYGFIPILFEKLKLSIKTLMIIQTVSACYCFVLIIFIFCFLLRKEKYFKYFDDSPL